MVRRVRTFELGNCELYGRTKIDPTVISTPDVLRSISIRLARNVVCCVAGGAQVGSRTMNSTSTAVFPISTAEYMQVNHGEYM